METQLLKRLRVEGVETGQKEDFVGLGLVILRNLSEIPDINPFDPGIPVIECNEPAPSPSPAPRPTEDRPGVPKTGGGNVGVPPITPYRPPVTPDEELTTKQPPTGDPISTETPADTGVTEIVAKDEDGKEPKPVIQHSSTDGGPESTPNTQDKPASGSPSLGGGRSYANE